MNNFNDLLSNAPDEGQSSFISREEYAAKKQAERKALYELSDNTAMKVAAYATAFRNYLDVQTNFDRYSAVNVLLILAQKPEAVRLGDFEYWKSAGGLVTDGTATSIENKLLLSAVTKHCGWSQCERFALVRHERRVRECRQGLRAAPAFIKPGQTGISILEPGKEYERSDGKGSAVGYNVKKVFDISQVDMRKGRTQQPPTYSERQLLKALIQKAPVKISGVQELPDDLCAMTNPETGEISVRMNMEFRDTFRSIAYELAGADLNTGADTQASPAFLAYCASYIICQKYGVDTQDFDFANAPDVFDGMDAYGVKSELSQIRNIAEDISSRIARQLDVLQKASREQGAR